MTPVQLAERIKTLGNGTRVEVIDLTGTQDHYQALVVSSAFAGKMMIDQHKMVLDLFKSEIESNEVHALTLKTFTPEQYEKFGKKR
jgi:acid stress-induced BolA-like protein IbaG/YrbA